MSLTRDLWPGDVLVDNDPRTKTSSGPRLVTVKAVAQGFAYGVSSAGVKVRIALSRIHSDGKTRTTGFNLR